MRNLWQFSLIFTLVILSTTASGEPIPDQLTPSFVRLRSQQTHACGSGVLITPDQILTNAHIGRTLCPKSNCGKVLVGSQKSASGSIQEHIKTLQVEKILAVPDLALLRSDSPIGTAPIKLASTITASEQISLAGFPGCEHLQIHSGKVKKIDSLHFYTTAHGSYGSSGSALLNTKNELIGIADEAATAFSAMRVSLFGGTFPMRAIRPEYFSELLNPEENFISQVHHLNRYYQETVIPSMRVTRILRGFEFLSGISNLQRVILEENNNPEIVRAFALADLPPSSLINALEKQPIQPAALALLPFATRLENNGLLDSGRFLSVKELQSIIQNSILLEDTKKVFLKLSSQFAHSQYPGLSPLTFFLSLCVPLLCILIALWAWSLGYVFARTGGTLLRRIGIMLLTGICFWPFSLLARKLINK